MSFNLATYFTAIRIGFELPSYTYMEPTFEETVDKFFAAESGLPINGPIYLAKENNVSSEQVFFVIIQASDSNALSRSSQPATINLDYSLSHHLTREVVVPFSSHDQRIALSFTLHSDLFPEGTESFVLTSAPIDTSQSVDGTIVPVSMYLIPTILSVKSYVIIEDDDRT